MIDVQDISVLDKVRENIPAKVITVDYSTRYLTAYASGDIKKVEIVKPQTQSISPVVNYIIDNLKNGTAAQQSKCLEKISKILSSAAAVQFLDEGITNALFYVVNQDTSKLKAPTRRQKKYRQQIQQGKKLSAKKVNEAYKLSEREIADRNKIYALADIAKIQNLLYDELLKRSDIKTSFKDMPAVPRLLEIYEKNPDGNLKAAAIGALYLMYRPEFKSDLKPIFEKAAQSQSPQVKQYAETALNDIEKK